jgi:aromatic-L-amino-acid decarboxylase
LPPEYLSANGREQDWLQQKLQQEIERSGEAWIHTTVLNDRRVLRININSFLTERRHVDDLLELLVRTGKSVAEHQP